MVPPKGKKNLPRTGLFWQVCSRIMQGLAVALAIGLLLKKSHVNIVAAVIGLSRCLMSSSAASIALLGLLHGVDVYMLLASAT